MKRVSVMILRLKADEVRQEQKDGIWTTVKSAWLSCTALLNTTTGCLAYFFLRHLKALVYYISKGSAEDREARIPLETVTIEDTAVIVLLFVIPCAYEVRHGVLLLDSTLNISYDLGGFHRTFYGWFLII
ncbi:hypothetical protein AVEN_132189-1 [Araneus ventricosus]|uniref:Uncharacterized protein n=1 Tax=Araneus ventricosus TaxID=182803 RepID=A0A4Y2F8B9_ARAVE|nr:hypothetical protein AVEN_132189-1 [Araneus ventricosus]